MKRSQFRKVLCNSILFGTLSAISMEAHIYPDPGCFGFEVTALYMQPVLEIPYYVMTASVSSSVAPAQTVIGKRQDSELGFHGGIALEGAYAFCNFPFDIRVRWSHLKDSAQNEAMGSAALQGARFIVPDGLSFRQAHSEINFSYNAADFLFGYIANYTCNVLSFHVGLQYASIKYREFDSFSRSDNALVDLGEWSLTIQGVGPKIGLLGKYLLPKHCRLPDLYLDGKVQFGAVIAKITSDSAFDSFDDLIDYDFSNQHTDRVVPFWDLALGLSSQCCFHSLLLEFELGYEFIHYHKALGGVEVIIDASNSPSIDLFTDVMLHGLYFSVGITY